MGLTKAKVNDRIEYIGDSLGYGGTYTVVDMNPEEPSEALVIIEFMNDGTPMFIPIENLNPKEWRFVDGEN
ncbi:hypothetical protein [Bacillus phage vB_BanS-Thrax3]|nr:hypothetical protein [Bacillus phage vB_BanS-Thrax3]